MSIKDVITLECIEVNLKSKTKNEVIDELIELLYNTGKK